MAKRRFRSRGRFSRVRRRRRYGSKRLRRVIKGTVRRMSEVKYVTKSVNAFQAQDLFNGVVVQLNPPIAQGVDRNQRIGNKVRYKYAQLRLMLYLTKGANPLDPDFQFVRVLVVQPRLLPAGGIAVGPVGTEIFDSPTNTAQQTVSSVNHKAVRVIMDRIYKVATLGQGADSQMMSGVYVKKKFKVNNNVLFRSAVQTDPQDPKDNYYLLIIGSAINNGDSTVNYFYQFRISYIDI